MQQRTGLCAAYSPNHDLKPANGSQRRNRVIHHRRQAVGERAPRSGIPSLPVLCPCLRFSPSLGSLLNRVAPPLQVARRSQECSCDIPQPLPAFPSINCPQPASIGGLKPTLMAIMADSTKTFRPSPVWCELLAVNLLMRRGALVLEYGQ